MSLVPVNKAIKYKCKYIKGIKLTKKCTYVYCSLVSFSTYKWEMGDEQSKISQQFLDQHAGLFYASRVQIGNF